MTQKILKELFGSGYLDIRPCEGPRVQIVRRGRRCSQAAAALVPRGREGRAASQRCTSLPTPSRQVGPLFFLPLILDSFQNPSLSRSGAVVQLSSLVPLGRPGRCAPASRTLHSDQDKRHRRCTREEGSVERVWGLRELWRASLSLACGGSASAELEDQVKMVFKQSAVLSIGKSCSFNPWFYI